MIGKRMTQVKLAAEKGRIISAKIVFRANKWRRLFPPTKNYTKID